MRSRLAALVIALLAVMQIVMVAAVIVSVRVTSKDAFEDHAARILRQNREQTVAITNEYLARAEASVATAARLSEAGALDLTFAIAAEQIFLESLAVDARLDGAFWGGLDGAFVYVTRDDSHTLGGYRTKVIAIGADGERTTTLTWRDPNFELIDQIDDPADTFDPRSRPWYRDAMATEGVVWTDPYIFFTARQPGVTAAAQVRFGPSPGVVGADMRLEELSAFLAKHRASASAGAYIATRDGTLVAHHQPGVMVVESSATGGEPQLATVSNASDLATRIAGEAAVDQSGFATFEVGQEPYLASVGEVATDWQVVVMAAERSFLGDLRASQQTTLYIVITAALAMMVIAIPVAARTLRPVEEAQGQAVVDPMTDLPNRRAFHLAADAIFTRARRLRRPVGAVMIDLDHFKRLNDTYGHLVGDEIVRAVAGRMRSAVAADDVVARFGGDEFAVLLYGADITTTRTVANRVRSAVIGSPIKTEHGPVYVTLSLGVAATDGSRGSTLEGLIHDADQALYKAKRAGRDRVEVAEPYEEAPA